MARQKRKGGRYVWVDHRQVGAPVTAFTFAKFVATDMGDLTLDEADAAETFLVVPSNEAFLDFFPGLPPINSTLLGPPPAQ